jgi:hypothetical protein
MDHENIPVRGEMSPYDAAHWAEALAAVDEHLRPALCAWVETGAYVAEGFSDLPSVPDFEDRYCGEHETFTAYAQGLAEGIGLTARRARRGECATSTGSPGLTTSATTTPPPTAPVGACSSSATSSAGQVADLQRADMATRTCADSPALHSGATVVVAVVEPHAIEPCARRRHGCALRPVPLHSGAAVVVAVVEPQAIESCNRCSDRATSDRLVAPARRTALFRVLAAFSGVLLRACATVQPEARQLCNVDAE